MRAGKSSGLNGSEAPTVRKRLEQGTLATIQINGGVRQVQIAGVLDGFVTSYDVRSGEKVSGGANFFTPIAGVDLT